LFNNKTNTFKPLDTYIQEEFDNIQGNNELSLQQKRDECCILFLENGLFGNDIREIQNKSHQTSWFLRRNKVLAYYGDVLSFQQQETSRRQRRNSRRKNTEREEMKSLLENEIDNEFGNDTEKKKSFLKNILDKMK